MTAEFIPLHRVLKQHPEISHGGNVNAPPGLVSGNTLLDQALPWQGWPQNSIVELLVDKPGVGEAGLLLPVLAALSRQQRWIAMVQPPWLPYPHGLLQAGIDLACLRLVYAAEHRQQLWALNQLLRSGAFAAVLAWPSRLTMGQSRKLQLAAEEGRALGFLIRPMDSRRQPSSAALRLALSGCSEGLNIEIIKCRGRLRRSRLRLRLA